MGLNMRSDEGAISSAIATLPPGYEKFPDVKITKLQPKGSAGETALPLWENGVYNQGITIPPGTWEMHVYYDWTVTENFYTIWITLSVSGVPALYTLQCLGEQYEGTGSYSDSKGFNMGVMPEGNVTVNYAKAISTNWMGPAKPPQDMW